MATTPCPGCGKAIRVPAHESRGACGSCGMEVRFVEAAEHPCGRCGKRVAFPPGKDAARCPSCGAWQAALEGRTVVGRATCPRCRRTLALGAEAEQVPCPHCGSLLLLADTL